MNAGEAASGCIWNGTFDNWDEAEAVAKSSSLQESRAFDSRRWLDKQSVMLAQAQQGLIGRYTNLPALVAASQSRIIIDFGGGSGWTYEIVKRSVEHRIISYLVIEQSSTVGFFAQSLQNDETLNYVSAADMSNVTFSGVDVLYSNSVLQYLATDALFIELVNRCNPRWILLDDYQNASGAEFATTQFYYGSRIPCRFMNVESLRLKLNHQGFSMRGQWSYPASFGGNLKAELGDVTLDWCVRGAPTSLLFERHCEHSPGPPGTG